MKKVGVMKIPNRCGRCGRFKPWDDLTLHFVPDSDWSSEDESWRECSDCICKRQPAPASQEGK